MKHVRLSIVALAVVAGCTEQPTTSAVRTPRDAASSVALTALRANGAAMPLTASDSGWIEFAFAASTTAYDSISAYWVVPNNPTGSYGDSSSGVWYRTFPALQNARAGKYSAILQPESFFDYTGWALISEIVHGGTRVSLKGPQASLARDTIFGTVRDTLCGDGKVTCFWRIHAQDLTSGNPPLNDTITDNLGPFTRATGGAVEVANITQCAQYPFGGVFYHGVYVGTGGQYFTPTWRDTVKAGVHVACSFGVYSHLDTVNLYHNYPPPAPLTETIVGPTYVKPNALCMWKAAHTGGTPPLTFSWRPPGTQEDSSLIEAFSSDVWLDVYVADSLNQQAHASKRVHVLPSAPACPYAPGH